jgi:hypothetical protein
MCYVTYWFGTSVWYDCFIAAAARRSVALAQRSLAYISAMNTSIMVQVVTSIKPDVMFVDDQKLLVASLLPATRPYVHMAEHCS